MTAVNSAKDRQQGRNFFLGYMRFEVLLHLEPSKTGSTVEQGYSHSHILAIAGSWTARWMMPVVLP